MPGKVGVVGFFLGGTSALALVGARLDADSYKRSCDQPKEGMDCAWFAKTGINLRKIDAASLSVSQRDLRIKVAVAVDPELSKNLSPESLAKIRVPVSIINLGESGKTNSALEASGLGMLIPGSRYERVADAVAFSAFSLCTPSGPALLREEGEDEDAICRDGSSRPREEIHREIADKIEAALHRALSASL
jgi:predicted dienelactone hydrolase